MSMNLQSERYAPINLQFPNGLSSYMHHDVVGNQNSLNFGQLSPSSNKVNKGLSENMESENIARKSSEMNNQSDQQNMEQKEVENPILFIDQKINKQHGKRLGANSKCDNFYCKKISFDLKKVRHEMTKQQVTYCSECMQRYKEKHYCYYDLVIYFDDADACDGQVWIQCEQCDRWVHKTCEEKANQLFNISDSYRCPRCVQNKKKNRHETGASPYPRKLSKLQQDYKKNNEQPGNLFFNEQSQINTNSRHHQFQTENNNILEPIKTGTANYSNLQNFQYQELQPTKKQQNKIQHNIIYTKLEDLLQPYGIKVSLTEEEIQEDIQKIINHSMKKEEISDEKKEANMSIVTSPIIKDQTKLEESQELDGTENKKNPFIQNSGTKKRTNSGKKFI